jgi:uncharacterized protein YndB with AHSA1/START domain
MITQALLALPKIRFMVCITITVHGLSQFALQKVVFTPRRVQICLLCLSYEFNAKQRKQIIMETMNKTAITLEATVNAPVEKVWKYWTDPKHIKGWAFASDDWHVPAAENDVRVDGRFTTTMAAKDGSFSFDFGGVYSSVQQNKSMEYIIDDGRKVKIEFSADGYGTRVVETFEPEDQNPIEMQRGGWQAILDNFKKYAETH